tara:strand:+ start:866 stop:2551 length:1686 start_codon:yes stop_codon:yes gene_type:complete
MSTQPIQLGSLDFDDIKENLKSFLSNPDNELDVDFDGSIANTVVDLLSYNTLYYAFYSNMLMNESFLDSAQRVESLISLSKPLGYTINHRNASTVTLTLNNTTANTGTLIPYNTSVSGVKNGIGYTFIYVNPVNDTDTTTNQLTPGETKNFKFYQSSSVVVNSPVTVDYTNQKFNINNKKLDPRTLRVQVNEADGLKDYTRVSNTNSSLSASSRVYYIETTRNGYTVYFGAPRVTEGSSVGRGVGETETVFISYVSSSGAGGNGTTNFTGLDGGTSITNSGTVSGGGYSSPNIDVVKFAAPRNFVGGGRLVSIADYEVGILNTGLVTTGSNPLNSISVYGSNSAAEQTPGKVLFSLFDTSLNSGAGDSLPGTSSVVSEIKTNFAEEVMLGTTFEYREPLEVDITFTSNSSVENFNSNYRRGFNQTFSSALNASLIKLETTKIPRSQEQTTGNFTGIASGGVIGLSGKFDFKNSIDFTSEGTTFAISFQENISIGGELRVATVSNNLITYSGGTLSSDNPSSGRFELDPNKFQVIRGITLNLTPGEIKVRDEILANPKITGS